MQACFACGAQPGGIGPSSILLCIKVPALASTSIKSPLLCQWQLHSVGWCPVSSFFVWFERHLTFHTQAIYFCRGYPDTTPFGSTAGAKVCGEKSHYFSKTSLRSRALMTCCASTTRISVSMHLDSWCDHYWCIGQTFSKNLASWLYHTAAKLFWCLLHPIYSI